MYVFLLAPYILFKYLDAYHDALFFCLQWIAELTFDTHNDFSVLYYSRWIIVLIFITFTNIGNIISYSYIYFYL